MSSDKSSDDFDEEIEQIAKDGREERREALKQRQGKRESPVTAFVRSLDGDYYMTTEVAEMLGVSAQTVRKLANDDMVNAPSYVAPFGKNALRLFTPEDVEELRKELNYRWNAIPRGTYERHPKRRLKDRR